MSTIHIETPIPGPRAQTMLKRRQAALPAGLAKSTEVVVERAGKLADLVVLDRDPLGVSLSQLERIAIDATYLGGVCRWKRGEVSEQSRR